MTKKIHQTTKIHTKRLKCHPVTILKYTLLSPQRSSRRTGVVHKVTGAMQMMGPWGVFMRQLLGNLFVRSVIQATIPDISGPLKSETHPLQHICFSSTATKGKKSFMSFGQAMAWGGSEVRCLLRQAAMRYYNQVLTFLSL